MSNIDYWQKRQQAQHKQTMKKTIEVIESYSKVYKSASDKIDLTILKYTREFANKNGNLSIVEARQKLSNNEFEGFQIKLKEYLEMAHKKANADNIKLINASLKHRISKLEALKVEMNIIVNELAQEKNKLLQSGLNEVYEDIYYKSAYLKYLMDNEEQFINKLDLETIDTAINQNWLSSGDNFSSIIWKNKEKLINTVYNELAIAAAQGKSAYTVADKISDIMQVDKKRAVSLVQTEMSAIRALATSKSMNDTNVEKYMILAALNEKTCPICGALDHKIFDRKDYVVGVTANPFHPNCQCTTIPYYEWLDEQTTRSAKDENGKTYTVENIKYSEWVEKYVKNPEKLKGYEQYARYKKVLGDKVPNSFDNFVDMKYNDSKEWDLLKGYKREIQTGNLTPLANFKLFKNISNEIDTKLIGTTAINGITIKSKSTHFISRIIGSVEQKRDGVNLDDVYDALLNGKVKPVRIDKNEQKSQKLFNGKVSVSINPDTGNLIQVNPLPSNNKKGVK